MGIVANFLRLSDYSCLAMVDRARIFSVSPFGIARMVNSLMKTSFALTTTFALLLLQKQVATLLADASRFRALDESVLKQKQQQRQNTVQLGQKPFNPSCIKGKYLFW